MGLPAMQPESRLSLRQGVQVLFVAALGVALTASLTQRGLPVGDVLLGALVTVLATGHVYALLWRENRNRRLLDASVEVARRAEAESKRAIREKREFMANVGHELGAPLAAIVGFAEVLRTGDDRSPAERREVIDTILRSGRRLLNITNDMLDLSRLEAGRLKVERGACQPLTILDEVETLIRPLAAQRSVRFTIEQRGPLPIWIHSDPARVRQILVNLATHALRTPERGQATLTISVDAQREQLVMEAPAGRAAGAVGRLLDQTESPATGRFDAARLGLVIVQRLTVLLGGHLELTSATGQRPVIRAQVATGSLEGVEMAPEQGDWPRREAPASEELSEARELDVRTLLVDPDAEDDRLIAFHLRCAGAEVEVEETAADGAKRALVASEAGRPFGLLVISAQEGELAEIRRLRQDGYEGSIVAIGASEEGEACDRASCLAAGCDEFVESPVSQEGLIAACTRVAPEGAGRSVQAGSDEASSAEAA